MKTEKQIFDAINPVVEQMGYEIVDVEFVKKNGVLNLTVFIDVPGGISLDDCEKVHYAVEPVLDELDPSDDKPYILNISSPGLDRPFKKQRDYERNYGKEVEVKLYAPYMGKKIYEGVLLKKTDTCLELQSNGDTIKLEDNRIALVRPLVKFE